MCAEVRMERKGGACLLSARSGPEAEPGLEVSLSYMVTLCQ